MTTKELQALVEQIGAHVKTVAELQITTHKLIHEGMAMHDKQIMALLAITQEHRRRLNEIQGLEGDGL